MTRPIPAAHLQAIFSPRRDTPRAEISPAATCNRRVGLLPERGCEESSGTYPFREWLDVAAPVDAGEWLRSRINERRERKLRYRGLIVAGLAVVAWVALTYALIVGAMVLA